MVSLAALCAALSLLYKPLVSDQARYFALRQDAGTLWAPFVPAFAPFPVNVKLWRGDVRIGAVQRC